jgi:hypothetical protein
MTIGGGGGADSNPSGDDLITKLKRCMADLNDLCEELKNRDKKVEDKHSYEPLRDDGRLV